VQRLAAMALLANPDVLGLPPDELAHARAWREHAAAYLWDEIEQHQVTEAEAVVSHLKARITAEICACRTA